MYVFMLSYAVLKLLLSSRQVW